LLGIIFLIQIFRGLILVLFYSTEDFLRFFSIQFLINENFFGWFIRLIHINFVRFFFIILFIHIIKAIYYISFKLAKVWFIGFFILLFLILESFLGYVLIWSQISYWACIVIREFLSIIPFFGFKIIFWIWSGYWTSSFTIKFFFCLHFVLPLVISLIIFLHCIIYLHVYIRTSILFVRQISVNFAPYYLIKDFLNFIFILIFILFFLFFPFFFNDIEIFLEKDELNSPMHIEPEWYFLFIYCILRSFPNKLLGIFIIFISIFLILILIINKNYKNSFNLFYKIYFFLFIMNLIILSWLGECEVIYPFIFLGLIFSFLYLKFFFYIFILFHYYSK